MAQTALVAPTPTIDPDDLVPCGCGKGHAAWFASASPPGQDPTGVFSPREASSDTDLISVDLDIEIVPASGTIAGSNTMRVRVLTDGTTQFTFRLRSQYTITSALVDGVTPVAVSGPPANSYGRTVTLPRAYDAGEEFTLRIAYNGTAVSRGFGSIEFQTQGGQPIVCTLSEPYFAATWWPIKDGDFAQPGDNSDKAVGRLAITVPGSLRAVANGLLEGTDALSGGRTRYRWVTNYPTAPYLFSFSATNYNTWTRTYVYPTTSGSATMPIEFNIYPGSDTPGNRAAWERVLDMLPVFRGVFGEYPFVEEKYGIYQFPFSGGMEHQTNTGQGVFDESITAHELAHQWWGDNVTCQTWSDIWLNEGFATYAECLWAELKPGSSGVPALRAAINARRPSATSGTVYVTAVNDPNRIFSSTYSYRKGAWVLHMLRGAVGDPAFFETLRQHRAAHEGSAATTLGFAAVASSVAGTDLSTFFDQWVFGAGSPEYAVGFQNRVVAGQDYTLVSVRQLQDVAFGSGQKFEMPLDLRVDTPSGPVLTRIANAARTQHYMVATPAPASGVTLDENDWVLCSKVAEAYVPGPPRLVAASPSPNASSAMSASSTSVALIFSDPVSLAPASFAWSGPSGAVPFSLVIAPGNAQATLESSSPLPPGTYTITLQGGIAGLAGGQALDGEIVGGTLPSGDGVPGTTLPATSSFSFVVDPPACPADLDDGTGSGTPDGGVTIDDLLYFLVQFDAGDLAADLDDGSGLGTPDGGVTIDDLLFFLERFDAGC